MAAALIPLLLGVVGVLFIVLVGWLFMEFSKPGQRRVPLIIIFAGLALGAFLFIVKLKAFAVVAVLAITVIGFVLAATAPDKPVEQPRREQRPRPAGQPDGDQTTGS